MSMPLHADPTLPGVTPTPVGSGSRIGRPATDPAYAVECPRCSARIGRPCRTPTGDRTTTHAARRAAVSGPPPDLRALERLDSLVRDRRDQIPCCGPEGAAWTSEDGMDRAIAELLCDDCPMSIYQACRLAAQAIRPTWGVWAGRDYSRPTESSAARPLEQAS